ESVWLKHLDRAVRAQTKMHRLIHDTHPAAPELADHAVLAREDVTGLQHPLILTSLVRSGDFLPWFVHALPAPYVRQRPPPRFGRARARFASCPWHRRCSVSTRRPCDMKRSLIGTAVVLAVVALGAPALAATFCPNETPSPSTNFATSITFVNDSN